MLYVFYVDTGTMLQFEMNYALENVSQLMGAVERKTHIPTNKQVLLVSGGVCLDVAARVCSYSAGTDTNPIFLFGKGSEETKPAPSPSINRGIDQDLNEQVKASETLDANYNSVVVRTQLAQQFFQIAQDQASACEQLVHEQHLMQQGWAAAVANLEDVSTSFRDQSEQLEKVFNNFLQARGQYFELLQTCTDDEDILGKIPLIPTLQEGKDEQTSTVSSTVGSAKEGSQQKNGSQQNECGERQVENGEAEAKSSAEVSDGSGDKESSKSTSTKPLTLLNWILSKEKKGNIRSLPAECARNMEQIDAESLEWLTTDAKKAVSAASTQDMKEIKGLEDRLFGLEHLMLEARRIVQEQRDLAMSLQQNQIRVSSLKDPSIFPDLCASHQRQLQTMLNNHHRLYDIRRRCTRAKQELCENLYQRRLWVEYVENTMFEIRQKYYIKHEMIKHVQKYVDVVRQIHLAPAMYLNAISEVVRRRTFSQSFLTWANELACQMLSVHKEEVARRRDFQNQFQGHFLNALFPGMEDMPSAFAMQAPTVFDSNLPKLTMEDIALLQSQLPDLNIPVPDTSSFLRFFVSKSVNVTQKSDEKEDTPSDTKVDPGTAESASMQHADAEASTSKPSSVSIHTPAPSKEVDKGFESETDTEEFEKVGQSPVKLTSCDAVEEVPVSAGLASQVSTVATLEENLGNTRNEVERLRAHLVSAGRLAAETMTALREDLATLRVVAGAQQEELDSRSKELLSLISSHQSAMEAAEEVRQAEECRLVQRLTVDHELEMDALKQEVKTAVEVKEEEIRQLRKEVEVKEQELAMLRADMEHRLEEEVSARSAVVHQLEVRLGDMRGQVSHMQGQLDVAIAEKQQAVRDMQDKLTHEYKTELESLRSRFRLMTIASMERSPSDSSLERIERPDMIELANHEAIVQQIRDDLEEQMEAAVHVAVEKERAAYEARLEQELKQARLRSEAERQIWFNEAMRRAVEEKERQVESLRAREASLIAECQRQQEAIRSFTDSRSLDSRMSGLTVWQLLDRIEMLKADKRRMELELAHERSRKTRTLSETAVSDGEEQKGAVGPEMSSSVAVVQEANGSRDVATSPDLLQRGAYEERLREKLSQSTTSLIQQGKISIVSCNIGDAVLAVWDEEYKNYTILQESSTLYFLHFDCLDALGLRPVSEDAPRRLYSTGEVIEKEYCHAKKPENRYRVPKGTKFYRVKVRPLQKESLLVRSHHYQKQKQGHHEVHHKQKLSQKQMQQTEEIDNQRGTKERNQEQQQQQQQKQQQQQQQQKSEEAYMQQEQLEQQQKKQDEQEQNQHQQKQQQQEVSIHADVMQTIKVVEEPDTAK